MLSTAYQSFDKKNFEFTVALQQNKNYLKRYYPSDLQNHFFTVLYEKLDCASINTAENRAYLLITLGFIIIKEFRASAILPGFWFW